MLFRSAILASQSDDIGGQCRLVIGRRRHLALRRAVLAQNPASQAFRDPERLDSLLNAGTAAGGAQKFPRAASLRISFSTVRSETARRRRAFSTSSAFSRFS